MAQTEVGYKKLLGRMPAILRAIASRWSSPPSRACSKEYSLAVEDLFAGRQKLRGEMEQSSLRRALAAKFDANENRCTSSSPPIAILSRSCDTTLLGALESAEKKMLHQFARLKGKAGRAENFRTGVLDRHERIIIDALYPHKGLQERTLGALPWLSLYGGELLESLETHAGESGATSACRASTRSSFSSPCPSGQHALIPERPC